jgi:hypothetical protein
MMVKQEERSVLDIKNIFTPSDVTSNSGYSNHTLNMGHTYGTITDTMDVISTRRKGRSLNTLKKYHINKISRNNLHMNNTHIEVHNPIFQTVHELYDR